MKRLNSTKTDQNRASGGFASHITGESRKGGPITERVLEGCRVLELGVMLAGPYTATLLGDMGAEVIKVEQPKVGDPMRYVIHQQDKSVMLPKGHNSFYEDADHSKKSITLDLSKAEGKEIFYRLVEKSDVLVTNFRPEALGRMKADYQTLSKLNPRLVYGLATTAGTKGPDKDMPGIDLVAQARTGIMMQSGEEGMPPIQVTAGLCDRATAIMLFGGIVSALLARERSGQGQWVHVSMLNVMTTLQGQVLAPRFMMGCNAGRWNKDRASPFYNYYECKDSRWIVIGLFPAQKYFAEICELLEIPEVFADPRFANDAKRLENTKALAAILSGTFAKKTLTEWTIILGKNKNMVWSSILTPDDLITDPQMIANNYIREWNHPVEGPIKYPGYQIEFSQTPMEMSSAAPGLGQHTEEVLSEVLGYDSEKLNTLREKGVL